MISGRGKISKTNDTLIFRKYDGTETKLYPFDSEQVVVCGSVTLTGDALAEFSRYQIPLVFLSGDGRYHASLSYGTGKNVFLRQEQYRILDDSVRRTALARSIVTGKIRNQIAFMQRIKRSAENSSSDIERAVADAKIFMKQADDCTDTAKLRAYEGLASSRYFSVFRCNLKPEWAEFESRSRRPPESNVNAVLSFLYTLLLYRIEGAVLSQGLDPMAGAVHELTYGKESLVFDLAG